MSDLSAAVVPPALLQPAVAAPGAASGPGVAEQAKRAAIKATAQKFETQFMSMMLQQMFDGTEASAPFGGGPGESMFKSFLTEAIAKQMTKAGGVGVADVVNREMLKMQGLS